MPDRPESDPIRHTQKIRDRLTGLIDHLRRDIDSVNEPQARALFETSAEVLGGLVNAFEHYETREEKAWTHEAS